MAASQRSDDFEHIGKDDDPESCSTNVKPSFISELVEVAELITHGDSQLERSAHKPEVSHSVH
jgi:hypothetical protein